MLQSSEAWAPQPLSLWSRAQEPQLQGPQAAAAEAHLPRVHAQQWRSHCNEKPTRGNWRKTHSSKDPAQPKLNKIFK